MSNANDFVIENSVLKKYTGSGGDVVIPEGVTVIGEYSFGRSEVANVAIPDSVTEIGECAFAYCNNLTTVTIPENVTVFGSSIFMFCENLKEVIFLNQSPKISKQSYATEATAVFPNLNLKTREKMTSVVADRCIIPDEESFAYVLLFQSAKTFAVPLETANVEPCKVVECITRLVSEEEKITPTVIDRIAEYISLNAGAIQKNSLELLLDAISSKNKSANKKFMSNEAIVSILNETYEKRTEHPLAAFVQELTGNLVWDSAIIKTGVKGISYADGTGVCSREAVMYIMQTYLEKWKEHSADVAGEMSSVNVLTNGSEITPDVNADKIAAALNREELIALLEPLATGNSYRNYILAYARFASEKSMKGFISAIKRKTRGNAREKYWAKSAEQALFLNDTLPAMMYLEKIGLLDQYAQMRGSTAQDLLDKSTLPELGFDSDGIKRYDIGGDIIELSVTDRLELQLKKPDGKVLRSFPKKGGDADKLAACAADFSQLKNTVKNFFKTRNEIIRKLYISGNTVSEEAWKNAYMVHPLLLAVSKLLIWEDSTGTRFMVEKEGTIKVDGSLHYVTGDIRLAHVLDLPEEEIHAWQKYLLDKRKPLLIEQVWEPIVDVSDEMNTTYSGSVISSESRNAMKKVLKTKGIDVHSDVDEFEFNHRAWTYEFSNSGIMVFGPYFEIEYTVNPETKDITFENGKVTGNSNLRALNAICFELNKAIIITAIKADTSECLIPEVLNTFTAAQIQDFVNLAIQSSSQNCIAILLDYKHHMFSEFDPMGEFTLDL